MGRFIEGADRTQTTLLPEAIDDYVGEDNPVRVVEAFVDALDLAALGFDGVVPEETGRPSYHPATLLKISQPGAVLARPRARVRAEPGADVAHRASGAGLQMDANGEMQVSLTDPDARAMATTSRKRRVVGYNVQSAVETKHHLIVALR